MKRMMKMMKYAKTANLDVGGTNVADASRSRRPKAEDRGWVGGRSASEKEVHTTD